MHLLPGTLKSPNPNLNWMTHSPVHLSLAPTSDASKELGTLYDFPVASFCCATGFLAVLFLEV